MSSSGVENVFYALRVWKCCTDCYGRAK